ncbi:MAG: hypothetical protein R2828_04355 [Saprospiraceae bacterium]
MKIRSDEIKPKAKNGNKVLDWTGRNYHAFKDYVAISEGDSKGMVIFKGVLSLLGMAFMVILSPFLVIGLLIAFAAVF